MEAGTLWMLGGMGLAGSLHCAGMCGPLAVLAAYGRRGLIEFPLYLAGKACSYIFLGALAGAVGEHLLRAAPLGVGARLLAFAGAAVLVAAAAESAGLLRVPRLTGAGWEKVTSGLRRLATEHGAAGKLLYGAANGLLPCPMTYGFLAIGAASGSALGGATAGLVLGLTSAAPLALCATVGRPLVVRRGPYLRWLAGAFMVAAAALLVYRGLAPLPVHAHCH